MYSLKSIKRDFSKAAVTYDSHAALQFSMVNHAVSALSAYLPANASVLDAGCGTGSFHRCVNRKNYAWRVYGCDIAFSMCSSSGTRFPVVNANIEQLPFPDQVFDGAISAFTLQWANDPERMIAECTRVIKPGGLFMLWSFGPATLQELKASFAKLDNRPHTNNFPDIEALHQYAKQNQLEVLKDIHEYYPHSYTSLRELIMHLRAIGAVNKHHSRHRGLLTPRYWQRLEDIYTNDYRWGDRISATWEVVGVIAKK